MWADEIELALSNLDDGVFGTVAEEVFRSCDEVSRSDDLEWKLRLSEVWDAKVGLLTIPDHKHDRVVSMREVELY